MTIHATPQPTDVIGVLLQNRASVNRLLDAYASLCERSGDTANEKLAIVERVSLEVTLDSQVEEELLFPALHVAGIDLTPFQGFHDTAWALIAQLAIGEPGEVKFDSKVLSLGRDLARRMQQVHDVTLPQLPGSGLDLETLGQRMLARKDRLMEAFDRPAEDEDEDDDPVGRPVSGLLH